MSSSERRSSCEISNLENPSKSETSPRIRSSPIDGRAAASGGGAGFVGDVGRPKGREGWGENGVDDRAVVSILPANLNPRSFHPPRAERLSNAPHSQPSGV